MTLAVIFAFALGLLLGFGVCAVLMLGPYAKSLNEMSKKVKETSRKADEFLGQMQARQRKLDANSE